MNHASMTGGSSTTLARALGWLVAIPFFVAGVMTTLLELDVTASPPRETPPNDLVEGTLAFSSMRASGGHKSSPPCSCSPLVSLR